MRILAKKLNERKLPASIVLTERRSGASDHQKKNKKGPKGIRPRRCPPSPPPGVKYVTVTQDKSPCLCSERHDKYLFGRAKTGGLGQVTTKKKQNHGKKLGITRPCPDSRVKKTGITRPRPDGGVKKWVLLDPVLTAG